MSIQLGQVAIALRKMIPVPEKGMHLTITIHSLTNENMFALLASLFSTAWPVLLIMLLL